MAKEVGTLESEMKFGGQAVGSGNIRGGRARLWEGGRTVDNEALKLGGKYESKNKVTAGV